MKTSTHNDPVTTTLSWESDSTIPQLIRVDDICKILALKKSTVYDLVATGRLRRPLKLGTSRRSAARWLLSDVLDFVKTLTDSQPPSNPINDTSLLTTGLIWLKPTSLSTTKRPRIVPSQKRS
jgi:excisionase family DNA binding protein